MNIITSCPSVCIGQPLTNETPLLVWGRVHGNPYECRLFRLSLQSMTLLGRVSQDLYPQSCQCLLDAGLCGWWDEALSCGRFFCSQALKEINVGGFAHGDWDNGSRNQEVGYQM